MKCVLPSKTLSFQKTLNLLVYKGQKIKKLPLSVEDQMKMISKAPSEAHRVLLLLFLSKGIHPICLAKPRDYGLVWDDKYVSWERSKTNKVVTTSWSKTMKEGSNLVLLRKISGMTKQRYWQMVKESGRIVGIPNLCPLRLRYTYFCNRGRLMHHPYDVSASSGTSMDTIYNYYTIGKEENEKLSDEERMFLKELIEP